MIETPDTVHGRLMESIHLSGYSTERAFGELEWLLDEDRWKRVAGGQDDINKFLATLDFSEFRHAIERRQKLAKRLQSIEASQRATARLLGVDEGTIRNDLGTRTADKSARRVEPHHETGGVDASAADLSAAAWFQSDADPSREAKRVVRNEARELERAERRLWPAAPFPPGLFGVVYADPPWQYEHIATESRAIENQYPTMTLDDICALPLATGTADDAVLFLWATSPKLAESMRVLEAWGFTYRTCMVWVKDKIGMGYYARQQHELLLIATKGTPPTPEPADRPASVVRHARAEHSVKPALFYELIERMYPQLPKIELFCRQPRHGWAAWGNQVMAE